MSKWKSIKNKLRSEFNDMEVHKVTSTVTGERCDDPPRLQTESVFKGRQIVAMYIVLNGQRVAYRGREGTPPYDYPAWIPMSDAIKFDPPGIEFPGNSREMPS